MVIRRIEDRISEYHSLPIFGVENISVHNARIDRFEVKFKKLSVHCQGETQFSNHILSSLRNGNELFQPEGRDLDYFLIRAPYLASCEPFKFRWPKNRRNRFSCQFSIKFNCNLNRFIAHQPLFRDALCTQHNDQVFRISPEKAFLGNQRTENRLKSAALDRNDNYLPHKYWDEAQDFTDWLEYYFLQLRTLVGANIGTEAITTNAVSDEELSDLLEKHQSVAVLDFSHWFIPYLEVSWDFQSNNAIAFIKNIEPAFRRASREFLRNEYIIAGDNKDDALPENQEPTSIERINNTYGLIARISKRLSIRLYAKTHNRIRMEVVVIRNNQKFCTYFALKTIIRIA